MLAASWRAVRPRALARHVRHASAGVVQPPTPVTALPNGLRVASQQTHDETVTVGVFVDSGSRFESQENNGTAHFLEHLAFKGTSKRARLALEREIENIGGHLNAYTSREQTVYYAKVHKNDLRQAMDILGDILNNSKFDASAVEVERSTILREMQEIQTMTEEVIFDELHLSAFRDSPLGFTILGPEHNIRTITRDMLIQYIQTNYTSDRVVVVAAGDVDHKALVEMTEQEFGQLKPNPNPFTWKDKPRFTGSEFLRQDDSLQGLAHVAVGYEGVSWRSADSVPFMVMQAIMGTYARDTSIVPVAQSANRVVRAAGTKVLADDEGGQPQPAVESFSFFNTHYHDTGIFGFYTTCHGSAVRDCVQELMHGINSMAHDITEEEVERGKRDLQRTLFGTLDSTTAVAEDIGRHLIVYGRVMPLPEFIYRIECVTVEDIKRVASAKIFDNDVAVAAFGSVENVPAWSELRQWSGTY